MPGIDQSVDAFKDYRCGLPEEIKDNNNIGRDCFVHSLRRSGSTRTTSSVVQVLRSERITQGPKVEEFEKALADYCGARYAVAVNSGTSALHIACLAAGVGAGHESSHPPITFVASANWPPMRGEARLCRNRRQTLQHRPDEIRKKMSGRTAGRHPRPHGGPELRHGGHREAHKADRRNRKFSSSRMPATPWVPCTRGRRSAPAAGPT